MPVAELPFSVRDLVELQDRLLDEWAASVGEQGLAGIDAAGDRQALTALVAAAHRANHAIWHLEDEARRRDIGDERVAALKREIDPWNQRRNDFMEAIDAAILAHFANVDVEASRLHSETAGMIIDRLSILALKIANVSAIAAEASVEGDGALAAECEQRRTRLAAQRDDLAACLVELLEDFAAGRRHFKSYLQLKAYNDERLNAALRRAAKRR